MKNQPTSAVTPVSDGQARHIGRIIEDASRTYPGGRAQAELAKGHPDFVNRFHKWLDEMATERAYSAAFTAPEHLAVTILGANNVVGIESAMRVWNNHPLPEIMPEVPYSEEILRQCAEENKRGVDWRLVWINGFSLRQQEAIRGRNRKKRPYFNSEWSWSLDFIREHWATQFIEPGYQLFDFKGRYSCMIWERQEDEIAKLGNGYKRAEVQAVTEACFTIYMAGGKKERLLQDWWHRGDLLAANGRRVLVGHFDGQGLVVRSEWTDGFRSYLRIVLSR